MVWPPASAASTSRSWRKSARLRIAARGQEQSQEIIAKAEKRAAEIVEEAKTDAKGEGERILMAARAEIGQEVQSCEGRSARSGGDHRHRRCQKMLGRECRRLLTHDDLLNKLAAQI